MDFEYIGDGVYAGWDGFGVWLHANSHDSPTDKIYIEPKVLLNLVAYWNEKSSNTNQEGESV